MNPQRSIWSDLPLTTGIAALVCYAGVFNDVIGIEELASRLGVSGKEEFYSALNKLHLQGSLILKDGFAGLPDLEDKIAIKASKIAMAHRLIASRLDCLKKMGRSPLIKFVGISGSLAAGNPIRDRNDHLDLDVFLITRNQCLWLYNILRGIRSRFPRRKQEPELCINYVVDESHLMISNRNVFTATEMRNLIPVAGMDAYKKLLQVNRWVDFYYPGLSGASVTVPVSPLGDLVNKCFYVVYTILRSIRWLDLDLIRNISFKTDLHSGISVHVLRPHNGGYQALVQNKFNRLAKKWFPELLGGGLMRKLFPDELSTEIRSGEIDVATVMVHAGLGPDYSKYA